MNYLQGDQKTYKNKAKWVRRIIKEPERDIEYQTHREAPRKHNALWTNLYQTESEQDDYSSKNVRGELESAGDEMGEFMKWFFSFCLFAVREDSMPWQKQYI